jgi:hypothetical protein
MIIIIAFMTLCLVLLTRYIDDLNTEIDDLALRHAQLLSEASRLQQLAQESQNSAPELEAAKKAAVARKDFKVLIAQSKG